jgi:hypothetical protein
MASQIVQIPSFEFAAFYYPQLYESLLVYKRIYAPELTDESDQEVSIQLLRAFALVGHLNNTLIDIVANESTLPTAQLPETIRNMLRLIDYELKPATPAAADIVYRLARTFSTAVTLVPVEGQVSTRRSDDDPVIYFESSTGVVLTRTDQVGACFTENTPGSFFDATASANLPATWNGPNGVGAKLYIGHATVMWDKLRLTLSAPGQATIGVWEFYDGDFNDTRPDAVVNLGGGVLSHDLSSLLGPSNRAGAVVRIRYNTTAVYETVTSTWNGTKNVASTTLLGQSSPSLDASDYTVGSDWQELSALVDGALLLHQTGDITFTLPQSLDQNWQKTTINGFTGYFLRFRIITTGAGSAPQMGLVRIDTGKQYAMALAYQGRTVSAETLGSSNGTQNQRFRMAQEGFILDSQQVRVDGEAWTRVIDFLNSTSGSKHYKIELGEKDRADVVFGDGVAGFIPPVGQGNVVADYRFGAQDDGNIGANTLVVDKQGLTYVEAIYNPRPATGWAEAESNSDAALAKAKIAGPASLRTKDVALSPDDLVGLAIAFTDSAGSKPFGRAFPIEESFGPKTVELVCVGRGGVLATNPQLDAVALYFNGDPYALPPVKKHFIANQQVVASNFTPHPITVEAIVYAPADVIAAVVENQLTSVLQPEALKEDGVTFMWEFGADVPRSRIIHEIFQAEPRITNVNLIQPAVDVPMGRRELPTAGSFLITMIAT